MTDCNGFLTVMPTGGDTDINNSNNFNDSQERSAWPKTKPKVRAAQRRQMKRRRQRQTAEQDESSQIGISTQPLA